MTLRSHWRAALVTSVGVLLIAVAALALATAVALGPVPDNFADVSGPGRGVAFVDRHGKRLNVTYESAWNVHDRVALHDVPALLRAAFLAAEDRRYYEHRGVDWRARAAAALANVRAGRVVRGASTISEQVVRMLHPRARTPWARWLEGFEAAALERGHGKAALFEFYLNQVPYAARRRGVVQAAHYYFDRDLTTLNEKELLALAVIVRAPRWFDPVGRPEALERAIARVADRLHANGRLPLSPATLARQSLSGRGSRTPVQVQHVLHYGRTLAQAAPHAGDNIHTTLDLALQHTVQRIVDRRLEDLAPRRVGNAAVLAVDHTTNEIRAWVVGNAGIPGKAFNEIDAVRVRRQPGSALKPLLYTEALNRGWSAATLLDDAPLEQSVGIGLHAYHNYSRRHYGPISLREALGNSLNIPAVRAIQFVGPAAFLERLRELGINGLAEHPNVYGDGLALGNGEVSLFELVQAYTVLARMGNFKPLTLFAGEQSRRATHRVYSDDVTSLIADILSDPGAREKEFGRYSILNFAAPTAVKTGTSSDYRDAWALGYDDRYTVGVWMGNLDYAAMDEVTGSTGPALVLRATFRELNRYRDRTPLYRGPNLVLASVCRDTGLPPRVPCETRDEWFIRGVEPTAAVSGASPILRVRKPSNGLRLAMDPRIPDSHEYFQFELAGANDADEVRWFVNGEPVGSTHGPTYTWKLTPGTFTTHARVRRTGNAPVETTAAVTYIVN